MKQCPTCNRTYSDDTLSFCLADGALLSAPYDSGKTEQFPSARNTEPPPTEILKQTTKDAARVESTIASPFSPAVENGGGSFGAHAEKKTSRLPWSLGGLVLLIAVTIVFIIGYNSGRRNSANSNGNSNGANPSSSSSPGADSNAYPANATPRTENSPLQPSVDANANSKDPRFGDPGVARDNANAPSGIGSGTPDDNGTVYKPTEVTQKARILSKPSPEYTDAARQNQVAGTVVLQMVLSSSGTVTNIRTITGLPHGLTEKAIAAARKIQFTPAMKDGRAVSQYVRVEYNFNVY